MLRKLVKIEEAEFRYFITIKTLMLKRKGYKQSDLNMGAERVFHNWASAVFKFPNSTPIGADLVLRLF
jgi:hypothetical protein